MLFICTSKTFSVISISFYCIYLPFWITVWITEVCSIQVIRNLMASNVICNLLNYCSAQNQAGLVSMIAIRQKEFSRYDFEKINKSSYIMKETKLYKFKIFCVTLSSLSNIWQRKCTWHFFISKYKGQTFNMWR